MIRESGREIYVRHEDGSDNSLCLHLPGPGILAAQETVATLQEEMPALDFQNQARLEAESSDEFTSLGTFQGLGGSDWQRFEGDHTKDLIRSFTRPLLRPAFAGHAFVLPPKTWLLGVSSRVATIEGEDFFKHGEPNREVFDRFEVQRQFLDLDLFYGFDGGQEWFHGTVSKKM